MNSELWQLLETVLDYCKEEQPQISEECPEIRGKAAIKYKTNLDEGISKTGRMASECRNSFWTVSI